MQNTSHNIYLTYFITFCRSTQYKNQINTLTLHCNQLLIRVPGQATDRQIKDFVRRKQGWIETHLAKAQAQKKVAEAYPKLTGDQLQALAAKASKVIPQRDISYL
jgi:predicted metal-dependent hydrolase